MKFDLNKIIPCFHSTLITSITAATILHARHLTETSAYNGIIPDDIIEEMAHEMIGRYDLSKQFGDLSRRSVGDGNTPPVKRRKVNYDRERAYQCIFNDYMSPTPLFDDKQFERVF